MLPDRLRVIYLHGFASSPGSRKACFFTAQLEARGCRVEVPDLAEGDFAHLTISKQLAVVERIARGESVILIGSSLGGYLAALYAARHPEVRRIVLLAPAFGFHQLWTEEFGPDRLRLWRQKGSIPVFHYGAGRNMLIGHELMEDAGRYEPFPDFPQPTLLFHGTLDSVVPVHQSREFAATRPNVRFVELNSSHELTDVLDEIWAASGEFVLGGSVRDTAPNPALK
jgi:pimeloyl-ACP methyl ester carboxylesterase